MNSTKQQASSVSIKTYLKQVLTNKIRNNTLNKQTNPMSQNIDYSSNNWWIALFIALAILSMLSTLIAPVLYIKYPKTRQHPAILLVMLCLAEFIEMYHVLLTILQINGYAAWQVLVFFRAKQQAYCQINYFMFFLCIFFQETLYMLWCIDFILTLKKPFMSTKSRVKMYPVIALAVSAWLTGGTLDQVSMVCQEYTIIVTNQLNGYSQLTINSVFQYAYTIASLSSVFLGLMTIYKARSNRTPSSIIKAKYIRQQIISIAVILIFWNIPYFATTYAQSELIINLSFAFICSQGILLGLLRLQEQYFRLQLFISFMQMMKMKPNKTMLKTYDSIETTHEGWNVPLGSLLEMVQNQEVIQQILQGIIAISMKNQSQTYRLDSYEVYKQEHQNIGKISYISGKETQDQDRRNSLLCKTDEINIRVVEYAQGVFRHLRLLDGLDLIALKQSLSVSNNQQSIQQLSESMGKSGSFFFFTDDKRLILKTISQNEKQLLMEKLLKPYNSYIQKNQNSLLAKLYGCFQICIDNVSPIYLILMENTFATIPIPTQVYDLKGSLLGRRTSQPNYGKDLNFLESSDLFIFLNDQKRKSLIQQIKHDSDFLYSLRLMDYSMLVGISLSSLSVNSQIHEESPRQVSIVGHQSKIISLGIIDYLQEFNKVKYLENKYKSLFNLESEISSVSPEQYSNRFTMFMNTIICSVIEH